MVRSVSRSWFGVLLAVALLVGCDADSDGGPVVLDGGAGDAAADAMADNTADVMPDAMPDAIADATPDALPDATPDMSLPDWPPPRSTACRRAWSSTAGCARCPPSPKTRCATATSAAM